MLPRNKPATAMHNTIRIARLSVRDELSFSFFRATKRAPKARISSIKAPAMTAPPAKPPPGVRWPCVTMYAP
jgi:hypothetical protein